METGFEKKDCSFPQFNGGRILKKDIHNHVYEQKAKLQAVTIV